MRRKSSVISIIALAGLIGAKSLLALDPAKAPILILQMQTDFGAYTGEILRAEGFNEFQVESPDDPQLTADYLNRFDVVILSETTLSPAQSDLLGDFVRNGGNLIAFRPDKQLAAIFGIADTQAAIENGYIRIEEQDGIGKGLPTETMQFHGAADLYDLEGARVIASLFRDAETVTGAPALVRHAFGKGHAVAFTFNLPKSIVLARQGNLCYAGLEKDGIKGIRAADMFTDGWVDPNKSAINQTDEQMRLLSQAIEYLSSFEKPLPRLWYFPGSDRSVIILTGDGEDSTEKDFDAQLADIKSTGARMTLYLKGTYIPAEKVKSWVADGSEISAHIDDTEQAIHPDYKAMDEKVRSTVHAFKETYDLDLQTVRNHWITWCGTDANGQQDFTAQASIEANCGIGLDCNYYHYDRESNQGHFLGPIGNFTGSGLPMKFMTNEGEVLDIYQSITQLPDEQWEKGNVFKNFKTLLDRSLDEEAYTFINVNLHTDRWQAWSRKEGLQIIDYAHQRNVPIWTAERTFNFLRDKDAAEFTDVHWSNDQLTFRLHVPKSTNGLTCMLPKTFREKTLRAISQNDESRPVHFQSIKGYDYALISALPGDNHFVATYTDFGE